MLPRRRRHHSRRVYVTRGALASFQCYAIVLVLAVVVRTCSAHFGLSSPDLLLTFAGEIHDNSVGRQRVLAISANYNNHTAAAAAVGVAGVINSDDRETAIDLGGSDACRRLRLSGWSYGQCVAGKDGSVGSVLMDAVKLAVFECQQQFSFDRWNCSLDRYRDIIIQKGYRESAFLHAISSAALVHTVARACSLGRLDLCTCDRQPASTAPNPPAPPADQQTATGSSSSSSGDITAWKWGGCGDNLRYASRFTGRLLDDMIAQRSSHIVDIPTLVAKVNEHNFNVGVRVVKKRMLPICRCHGVSGSCTARTCWRQLSPFHVTAASLKRAYDKAIQATPSTRVPVHSRRHSPFISSSTSVAAQQRSNDGHRRRLPARLPVGPRTLAYGAASPNYCELTDVSAGTRGRRCRKQGDDCDALCCGRGYDVTRTRVVERCKCRVVWCCEVHCEDCWKRLDVVTCK